MQYYNENVSELCTKFITVPLIVVAEIKQDVRIVSEASKVRGNNGKSCRSKAAYKSK